MSEKQTEIAEIKFEELKDRVHEQYEEIKKLYKNLEEYDKELFKANNKINKAVRTLKTLKGSARWERHLFEVDGLINILEGDSDGLNN
ncbi:MAG: hypothetical protein IJA94_06660 [Bacilli bacterium]|nr:hypothetical protein [Bacilli bacterium]MBQ3415291.1 hypothetical protein [Clostridia bacterium]MBQ6631553.1 hypothetical protein [Romboutsia sp.]MBR0058195.1 hypothetical protein [Methanobrevibacter sp.]MBQ4584552.1 hypothetical protein [Bacilli bacterium]